MHGKGTLLLTSGEIIDTTWDKGYRHGDGTITDKLGKKQHVVYYYDLEMKSNE